ncbi:MAG: hypothetical protein RIE60_11125, partial [Roseovarius sp.]
DTESSGELNATVTTGAIVMSTDGEIIGEVTGTRVDDKDGSTQAIIELSDSLGAPVEKVAVEAQDLTDRADGELTYGMSVAQLQSRIAAQVEATSTN